MKRTIAIALFALATWTVIPSAPAQEIAVHATIPFRFAVGSTLLPAGSYTFSSPLSHVLRIQHGTQSTTAVFNDSFALNPSARGGRLVFARHGDQYFLRAVESASASIHARLPQFHIPHSGPSERAAQWKDDQKNGTVLVALK